MGASPNDQWSDAVEGNSRAASFLFLLQWVENMRFIIIVKATQDSEAIGRFREMGIGAKKC